MEVLVCTSLIIYNTECGAYLFNGSHLQQSRVLHKVFARLAAEFQAEIDGGLKTRKEQVAIAVMDGDENPIIAKKLHIVGMYQNIITLCKLCVSKRYVAEKK